LLARLRRTLSCAQSAFPGVDAEKLAEEERFLDRIAYVCQKMKVPHSLTLALGNRRYFSPYIGCYKRDQERAAAHPKRKITFVFIPLSGIGEEQVETLKDLEDDPNAAFFFGNSKGEPRHKYMCI